jgi:hypothetical protein
MRVLNRVLAVGLVLLLAACGGGGSDCKAAWGSLADCDAGAAQSKPVVLNAAPSAVTTEAVSVITGSRVDLDGSTSVDVDRDTLNYSWTLLSRPPGSAAVLTDRNTPKPFFVADVSGVYRLRFSVDDGKLSSPEVDVTVTAALLNLVPTASAGPDRGVVVGSTVTLDGTSSRDPNGDKLTYFWEIKDLPEGSKATLFSNSAAKPSFVADLLGKYRVALVVSDGVLSSDLVVVTITASENNLPPVADAGTDVEADLGGSVMLDGSASSDPNGDNLTYDWVLVRSPAGSTAALLSRTAPKTVFVPDVAGLYVFSLVVRDGILSSSQSFVNVTIQ